MRARDIERIIFADGWVLKNTKESHRQYVHPDKRGKVTIPFHSKELNPITIKSILRQVGLTESAGE